MTATEPLADTARTAAQAWHRGRHERLCDLIEPWEHGYRARASAFPTYWDYNVLAVVDDDRALDAGTLAAAAEDHHGDLAHRKVQVFAEELANRVRSGMSERGFACVELLYMVHDGELPPVAGDVELRSAPDAAARPLREQWYATEPWVTGPEVLADFLAAQERAHALLGGHVLLVDGSGPGGLAAYVRVEVVGAMGEIGEAYAIPEARGRGIGGTLVAAGARAISEAGAEHVLIVADAAERAQHLYERLGFRTVWRMHDFTRRPGAPAEA
jgi:ribosomal protein S18 acetylase RimI-like enzyme